MDIAIAKKSSFFRLSILFLALFFDFLAFSAVFPLIPLLILKTTSGLLPYSMPLESRCMILGGLYSIYPLAQMLFSPLLGFLSDKFGRKALLLSAYLGNATGYFVFGMGIFTKEILFLFAGFFLAGATGCNISTTNTIIADIYSSKEKLQRYSFSHIVMSLALILGPFLAGQGIGLCSNVPKLAFYAFLSCSLLSLINSGVIYRYFKNPAPEPKREERSPIQLKLAIKKDKKIIFALCRAFLLFFGWYSFIKFFQALFLNTPGFEGSEIFNVLSYFGICCVISQLLFSFVLHKFFSGFKPPTPKGPGFLFMDKKLHIPLLGVVLAFSIFCTGYISTYPSLMAITTLFAFAYSILCPCLMYEISEFGSKETGGRIMGLYQSIQDLAKILAPLLAGYTMAFWDNGPVLIATSFILASLPVFYLEKRYTEKHKRICTEQDSNL